MPKFLTIGYGDQAGYDSTSEAVLTAAHEHDVHLVARGAVTGIAGKPVQVRNHDDAGVRTEQGPFMHASLPVAGFSFLEAADEQEAIDLVSKTPCAVAHGVVEIWPLEQLE